MEARDLRSIVAKIQGWLAPELAYLRGQVDVLWSDHRDHDRKYDIILAGQAKLIEQNERILFGQQQMLTLMREQDKEIKAMSKAQQAEAAKIAELQTAFNNYTNAAGAALQAKIDAAVKAQADGDDAAANANIAALQPIIDSLVNNTPLPAQPATGDSPATDPIPSPVADQPSTGSDTVTGAGADSTTGGADSVVGANGDATVTGAGDDSVSA